MLLTRFVRIQLAIFATLGILGMVTMVLVYMQVPVLVGVGRSQVAMELPSTGGLYRFSNVTYRGAQVGKVTDVELTDTGVRAVLSLDTSVKIPADLQAQVRSVSAVGEQYVDLRPRTDSGPYLHDGSVISLRDTQIPAAVGPVLDKLSALVSGIPKDKLGSLLDETHAGLVGIGDNFGSLIESGGKLAKDFNSVGDQTRTLAQDGLPFLDSQAASADSIRTWAPNLADFTNQLVVDDPQLRTLINTAPAAEQQVSRLLDQLKPTLPVLLANLTTVGQVLLTYNASLRQLLVLLPPYVANTQSYSPQSTSNGVPVGDFAISVNDVPPCTVGFLPPSSWRSPADTSDIDTPSGMYCKLPQDSPVAVRGARNYPCMGHPGKRAPTVEICDSDKPYEPLAMRPHMFGPGPIDPNLIAQGIPPDDRVTLPKGIYAPVEGTPLPPGATPEAAPASEPAPGAPVGAPPGPAPGAEPPPVGAEQPTPSDDGAVPVTPNSFRGTGAHAAPAAAALSYDPRTGRYAAPSGQVFRQSNLSARSTTWTDLMPVG